MVPQHPRAGVAHYLPGLVFSRRLVTVYWTVGAGWFVFAIGAFVQPHPSIVQELLTRFAEGIAGTTMVGGTIDAHHFGHGQQLTGNVFLVRLHFQGRYRTNSAGGGDNLIHSIDDLSIHGMPSGTHKLTGSLAACRDEYKRC